MSEQQEIDAATNFEREVILRRELLELLEAEPHNARELTNQLSMSRSTVHRVTESLDEFGLVEKTDDRFEVTGLGDVLVEEVQKFGRKVHIAEQLEPFLNTIDTSAVDIPLECFSEVTVTYPRHRQAHVGVNRIIELIEQTESLRMLSSIISPLYVDVARKQILKGTEIEVVFDEEVVDIITDRYAEAAQDALETGRFNISVGQDVPFELFLFDERMGMAAHDDSGIARAFVESPVPEARSWAEELYEEFADQAEPLD